MIPPTFRETAAVEPLDRVQLVRACVQQLAHYLPAQAPLRDFVHHNTLHAFQHLPFAAALGEAARLTGARPWLHEERCRELFRQGRIDTGDLVAALGQLPHARSDQLVSAGACGDLRRGAVLLAALLHPPDAVSAVRLRWLREESAAFARLPRDLDPDVRQRLVASGGSTGEAEVVGDIWAVARELRRSAAPPETDLGGPPAAKAAVLWQEMLCRLGRECTFAELLAELTGEDFRQPLQVTLIRHLAAHLDQGLAAWRNPSARQGFYAAWRRSAVADWAWELDEFAGARSDIEKLPDDPLQLIADELSSLGVDEAHYSAYLRRLLMELPGWAGMVHWRESHASREVSAVSLIDFLAVRLVLERLYAEHLVRRVWELPLRELGSHFANHPAELSVRHAVGSRTWPDELLDLVRPHLLTTQAESAWKSLADRLAEAEACESRVADEVAAWPLFVLALRLGLSACDLRALGAGGAESLLSCATSLTDDERGLVWLLAYERHYRQQILAALRANHGRAASLAVRPTAQLVFCMDDREEGTRRHLEEVNPTLETFGAAGFFGMPMLWQGLDDESPTALCPVVVRPVNFLREEVPEALASAYCQHRRRRGWRLAGNERLHQGSRRGWVQAALLIAAAAPLALLGLLLRTLAPGSLGKLLGRWRESFDKPMAGSLQVTAGNDEAKRVADADAPRCGFNEEEQVARVGGFLRSIGLTNNFAPLVLIVGHGSDSRNNPHLAAYDCGACSGRHGGPNARVFATIANRQEVRERLVGQGIVIPETTLFVGAEHNTCDESFVWYDDAQLPASHREAYAALRRDCAVAARRHAVERCRRFASAPRQPSPQEAQRHLLDRRHDIAQARPELGHATVAAAFVGRRAMSRGAFFDRRVFLISYDPLPDRDGRILEATLLAAAPVGAGISLEYYFSTVDNDGFGCGSKIMHNLTGLFAVMQGAVSDLRTGLPLQMVEIHEAMRLLVVVEQTREVITAIYHRQQPLQELIGNGWIVLAAQHPETCEIDLFDPVGGWQAWHDDSADEGASPLPIVECSSDWFAGRREPLPPALLRRPVTLR